MGANDTFLDASTSDNDVLNTTLNAASGQFTAQNIETINANFVNAAANLQLNTVTGVNTVGVSGSTAGQVSGWNAQSVQPTVSVADYTNTVTLTPTTLAGTTANNNAETINVEVSGASFGTTANAQTNISIDGNGGAGTLETLNVTSSGEAANTFALNLANGALFGTINVDGEQDATVRLLHGDISGRTVDATENTGEVELSIDRDNAGTASTNLTNVSGVDRFTFRDSTNGVDALVATNVAAGAALTAAANFVAPSSVSVAGAASRTDDALSLTLDHATANTGVTLGGLDVQNVETLNLVSNGNSGVTLASGNGNSATLTGDYSAINLTGDTAVTLSVNVDAPAAGNMTTAINASDMTAAASISAAADTNAANRYTITGSDNNDVLTGGAGNDTITGGAGNDRIVTTNGQDTITLGEGVNTVAFGAGANDVDAVATIITDFTTGTSTTDRDVIEIENGTGFGGTAGIVANLANSYVEGTVGTVGANDSATVFASNSINVITDQSFASFADVATELALENGGTALEDYAVVFLNSTTGFAELWVDDTTVNATNDVQLASFQNITTLTGVADFDAANFTVA